MRKLNSDVVARAGKHNRFKKEDEKVLAYTFGTFEWVQATIIAVAIVVIALTFVFRFVDISGDSMLENLHSGDKVLVSTFMYSPHQGDVIVISHAQDYEEPIVKRVIATEGQTVDIDFESGKVFVDGEELYEPYLTYNIVPGTTDIEFPVTVPEGCVFVLGDNRPLSLDSRYARIGFIEEKNIVGKVEFIVYPLDRISGVD